MRRTLRSHRRLLAPIASTVLVLWLLAAPASGWTEKLLSFSDANSGGRAKASVKLSKCNGGKLGTYSLLGIVYGYAGDTEIFHRVKADVSVRERWRPFRDVSVELDVPKDFDPNITAEIVSAYGDFYDGIETRWSPGELEIRHPELRVFGAQILAPGVHKEDFKPKPGC